MQRITKDPEIRKQEILEGAFKLFNEKGYDQTSMLDITKSINVSQGLCYRYFKSKEEIYQAALNAYVSQGVECFVSLLGDKNKSIIEIINTMPPISSVKGLSSPYHDFFNLKTNSSFHLQMEIALINRLIPIVAERLDTAKEKGEIKLENSMAAASFYLFGQMGIWQLEELEINIKIQSIRDYVKKILGV